MVIWVVTPCFYDIPSFKRVQGEVKEILGPQDGSTDLRFVVVDDSAGQDREVQTLAAEASLTVITPPYNLGHQGALVFGLRKLGLEVAPDDMIVTMDSDGEDRPIDLSALLAPLMERKDNLHVVSVAKRTKRKESVQFKLMYFFYKIFFWTLTGKIIRNGNFAAMRGWFLKEVIFHPHFDQSYSSTFVSLPLQLFAVPIPRGDRYFGKSKMGLFGLITHGFRMLMPFSEKIAIRVIIFSALGFSLAFATLAAGQIQLSFALVELSVGIFIFGLLLFSTFSQTKSQALRQLVRLGK